ncbi:biopolymer transporter ExbD, partial [Gammaproteobacteria bacterium]|nr:biopolymer transporter ExbD [Gammaproteobacteria bacterium]
MKFINNQKSSFSIEITPLIDIVFLLVIFFVVTSKVGDSQFLSLDLPKTESFEYNIVESMYEISVIADGSVYINDVIYNINDVKEIEQAIF